MKLSIVIVNYNVKHFLEQCLYSVEKAIAQVEAEVFVVDNNSVDGSNGMVLQKFPWVRLIANKQNLGFSKANNQAIKIASGEYILLLNPDTVVEETTFEKVIAFMDQHPEAGGLGVKMIDGRGHFLPESKRGFPTPWVAFYKIFGISALFPRSERFGKYHLSYLDPNKTHSIDVLAGAFMFMRKSALDKVGLLDEDYFMYGEDIDLSYRIIQGGYKNYYFPDTTIIHYKGESTKKGSLNYVRMFYNAMIIFARKHFSKQYAGLFSFFIHLAIYFRAALATLSRISKQLWLPALDFLILFIGFRFLFPFWEKIRYEPGYYPDQLLDYAVPVYIFSWLLILYYTGGYEKPVSLIKIGRGMVWGTLFILVVYSLLPESARFSRAIILLGALLSMILIVLNRLFLHFLFGKEYLLTSQPAKRIAIVGIKEECERIQKMLVQSGVPFELEGYISPDNERESRFYIGSIEQVDEIARVNGLDELIFCSENISSQTVIKTMLALVPFKLEYKIAPPQSISIIGSNSIDTSGDLYVVNNNAISDEKNKRSKRLLDFATAMLFLITFPINVWFIERRSGFAKNIFQVLFAKKSWIGYHPVPTELYLSLPVIRPGILKCTERMLNPTSDQGSIDRVNMSYARDYKISTDIEIIWKSFRKLGQS